MSTPDTSALIESLWATFTPVVESRVAAIEAASAAVAAGADATDTTVAAGHAAAHALAGALGSYGRADAGALARRVMVTLEGAAPDASSLRALVAELKAALS